MPAEKDENCDYDIQQLIHTMCGQKILEVDRKRIDPKFICTICERLLVEPMQTLCGHLMCHACVQTTLNSSNPVCPKDGTKLKNEEIFSDAFTRREISALHLQCPNSGCDWSGTYKELQDHSKCCGHSPIECVHVQCKKEIKRFLLAQHLEQECNYRLVKCTYCEEELPFCLLKEHVDARCLAAPLTCKHCGLSNIPRRAMNKHEMLECDEIPAECDFNAVGCTHSKVTKRKDLRQHFSDGLIVHVRLLLNFVLEMFGKIQALIPKVEITTLMQSALEELKQFTGSLSKEVKTLTDKYTSMLKNVTGLEKRVESLELPSKGESRASSGTIPDVKHLENKLSNMKKSLEKVENKNQKLENELREKTSLVERLCVKLDQIDHSMALTTVKLSDMETTNQGQAATSYNGTQIWKIDGFTQKRQDAVNGVQTAMYSPYFYSGQFGYKMRARIYLNGDGFGKDTHVSLFFVVMKGEYDALLPWPFQKKITMMLMDQNNGNHMIDAFRSDPQSSSFQRPKSDMNIASGCPLFVPLDGLTNQAYVKDDTLFIKIMID